MNSISKLLCLLIKNLSIEAPTRTQLPYDDEIWLLLSKMAKEQKLVNGKSIALSTDGFTIKIIDLEVLNCLVSYLENGKLTVYEPPKISYRGMGPPTALDKAFEERMRGKILEDKTMSRNDKLEFGGQSYPAGQYQA